MKKTATFLAIFLIILQVTNSCANRSHKNDPIIIKKFTKVIPNSRNGGPNYSYRTTRNLSQKARLNNLENGFDSIFIRMWYQYKDTVKVFDFHNTNGKWLGQLHIMKISGTIDSVKILNSIVEKKNS
jgi:hypothetical protein